MNEQFLDDVDIPKLSDNFKQILDRPITKKELYDSVLSMKQNKTPGFDGFPVEFYIVFWPDISDILFNSYKFSMENGLMSISQRNGIITLLPKKDKDCMYIKNYRPISLLTVDYKIFAKALANRLKKCIHTLIHPDQSGFLKGRNIGNNIRLILDIIDYTDIEDIPGAILLLDIEKAFDSVSHQFLFQTLKKFNFGDQFISWVETIYSCRKSYIINNGFLTEPIDMCKGIFQGCPISPYLFLLVIETMSISVRQNEKIKGIPVYDKELKISLLADDSTCFIDGSQESFDNLFGTLNKFAQCSGCKINLSKSEAIWIGAKKGTLNFPYSNQGLTWKTTDFKTLGIHFSLKTGSMFHLNYKPKLKQIDSILNCWRARNLSLIGKICVIKTLLLPQLLYLFSVLCIKIPKYFFKEIDKMFYKFIWNGGKDRVKRIYMCNNFDYCGLRMIDPYNFSLAQKMTWVKLLFDNNFQNIWKTIELSGLDKDYGDMLWDSYAPESILNKLHSSLLADSIRTWYIYRESACQEMYGVSFFDIQSSQCLWFNRNIRSKTKQYFYYKDWYDKGILYVTDFLNPPHPGSKLFEELVLDFDISRHDRRKFNFLMKSIPSAWLHDTKRNAVNVFDDIVSGLLNAPKIPRFTYCILNKNYIPENRIKFWDNSFEVDADADEGLEDPEDTDWEEIHNRNFRCSIETRLRSFYFKIFHNAIAFNNFLFKINRKDSPNCDFCQNSPETIKHIFCNCEYVTPIWENLVKIIQNKFDVDFTLSNFEKIFGVYKDNFLSYLILCVKYYIYICKFQDKKPNFINCIIFIKSKRDSEYVIAQRRGKLSAHFKKWRFDL